MRKELNNINELNYEKLKTVKVPTSNGEKW